MAHTDQTILVSNVSLPAGHHHLAAMVLEVTAPKAGNVHPQASFDDVTWLDFVSSAIVSSPILARAKELGVGQCVLQAVRATIDAAGSNTNLGMLLLLAPLGAAADMIHTQQVLDALDQQDAIAMYQAIALASPGGLGKAESGDVHDVAAGLCDPPGVIEAMTLAAGRDLIARQYTNDFADVRHLAGFLARAAAALPLDQAIVLGHLHQMARQPDTLIARKLGGTVADDAAVRAKAVLDADWPQGEHSHERFASLDHWLRDKSHQRNPGSSADLVAAALYMNLRNASITLPVRWLETISP
jgi:triphosphoribosyl-dephospho-CoA synthase